MGATFQDLKLVFSMMETGNTPREISQKDRRSQYFIKHPFSGQPLLRRAIDWSKFAGLKTQSKDRELVEFDIDVCRKTRVCF